MSAHKIHHRSLISISGRDTFKYLQALTTNNLATPKSQYTSFLNAQGRVLYDAFLYRTAEDACLLECDSKASEGLLAHLKRYKLRSKFTSRLLEQDELSVFSVWDTTELPVRRDGLIVEQDWRSPAFGHRILTTEGTLTNVIASNLQCASFEDYTYRRYQHGIPEGIKEIIPEKALPMESNFDHMQGLDFHKGCYLGQELTVRTHHTGVIRKRIMPVRFKPEEVAEGPIQWTTDENSVNILQDTGTRGRPAGRLLTRMKDLGLAICRLEKLADGQQAVVEVDGKTMSIVAFRPAQWSEDILQV